MVFARNLSDPLTSLVKQLDSATAKNADRDLGSFVVFLNDDEGFDKKIKELAKKEHLEHTPLMVMSNPTGPSGYNIAKDADITVVLYVNRTVKVNHAFKKGELKPADVDKIVAELPEILPKKKK
jgi:hypothetical protein